MPIRTEAGTATKNTCNCGISRDNTPRPRLNRMPKAMKGEAIWTPRVKPRADRLQRQHRRIAEGRHRLRRQHGVAPADRVERHVVQVGGQDQRDAEEREEVAERRLLPALRRIHGHRVGQAELLRDDQARRLQGGQDHPHGQADHQPDQRLREQQPDQARAAERVVADRQQGPHHREQNQRDEQGEGQPDARRDRLLADARHQHDQRADAREGQQVGRRDRRQEQVHGGVIAAAAARPRLIWPVAMRAAMRVM